jgi:anti-anti-sigma factor
MNKCEWTEYNIEESEKYLEKLNQCQQIISDLGAMVALGYGYRQCYSDGLYWSRDVSAGDWLPPVGDWDNVDWPAVMDRNVTDGTKISCVPEYLLKLWQKCIPDRIEITESRDQWDYILYTDRIEEMKGGKLKSFRQEANRFRKKYPDAVVIPLKEEDIPDLLAFHEQAEEELQERVNNVEEARREDAAIRRILKLWGDPRSHLFGFILKVNGDIASVAVNERINEFSSIGIYQKNNYNFEGINAYTILMDAQMQREMGIMTENIMQDEGVENLRFAKEHLSPLVYIRKYTVIYHSSKTTTGSNELYTGQTWTWAQMKLTRKNDGDDCYFTASGRVTSDNADMFSDRMMAACDPCGKIRLDLSDVEYMSSAGLRVLLSVFKKKGAEDFAICGVSDYLRDTLEMVGYDQILNIETEDQANGK